MIKTFHWDSLGIGLCFLPLSLPSLLSPVVGTVAGTLGNTCLLHLADCMKGFFVDRHGPRIAAFLGFSFLVPVFLLLRLVTDDSTRSCVLFLVLLTLAGFSFTAQLVSLMVAVSEPVERQEKEYPGIFGGRGAIAQAYALHNIAWASGEVIGPVVSGALVEAAGWTVMVTVLAMISGATAVLLACTNEEISRRVWRGKWMGNR